VTKDRMYTFGAKSEARRSGQTAMFIIVDGLARLLAPILSATMDELWRMLPGEREASVHMALFPTDVEQWKDAELLEHWERLLWVRNWTNLALEEKRSSKVIASNLSAKALVKVDEGSYDLLEPHLAFLPTLLGVSDASLIKTPVTTELADEIGAKRFVGEQATSFIAVEIERATGAKCERCWRYVPEVSQGGDRVGLCSRCVEALAEPVSL